jgi:hypothetical protein
LSLAAKQRCLAVEGQSHAYAESACANLPAARELSPELRPRRVPAPEHPRCADLVVVARFADQRGIPSPDSATLQPMPRLILACWARVAHVFLAQLGLPNEGDTPHLKGQRRPACRQQQQAIARHTATAMPRSALNGLIHRSPWL